MALAFGILVALTVALIGVPLIWWALQGAALAGAARLPARGSTAGGTVAPLALLGPRQAMEAPAKSGGADVIEAPPAEAGIHLDGIEGRINASAVRKVGEIVEKHPEEALSIIRAWMYQEA